MKNKFMNLTNVVFSLYLLLLSWLILFKLSTNLELIPHIRNINLIPLADSVIVNGKIYIKEIIYNVLAFIPLGVYISIIKNKWNFLNKLLIGFILSLAFEIMQYVFAIGGSDITDLISNTLGTSLGIGLYILLRKIFKNKATNIINMIGLVTETCAITLLILLTMAN